MGSLTCGIHFFLYYSVASCISFFADKFTVGPVISTPSFHGSMLLKRGDLIGKLIDFGVTLRHGEWESDMQNHGKVGTYPFMSPEMCFNSQQVKAAAVGVTIADYESYDSSLNDVWTLGHTLWGFSMGVLLWSDISNSDARFTLATRAQFCSDPTPWRFRPKGLRYLAERYGKNRTSMCTENLIDLMEHIFCPEADRWTAEKCLEHPWFDDVRF